MDSRSGNGADGGNIHIKHHVLYQIGVVEILMFKLHLVELRVGLSVVGIRFDHTVVANVDEDDDLVLIVQIQYPNQLMDGSVGVRPSFAL